MRDWWAAISLRGLRVQILLWTILPLTLLLIAFALTGIRSHQRSMRTFVAERDAGLVQALADEVENFLDRYTIGLQTLASSELLNHDNPQVVETTLIEASQRLDGITLLVVDENDQVVVGPTALSDEIAEAIDRLTAASSVSVEPIIGLTFDGHTLLWAIPLDQGARWLVGGLPVSNLPLNEMFAASHLGASGTIALVDQDGHTLYGQGLLVAGKAVSDTPGVAQALAGERGVRFEPDPKGEQVVAYAPIPSTGWALVLHEPWEPLAAPLGRLDRVMPIVLLIAAVTSILALYFGLRYVARPLQKLGMQADQIGQGDFEGAAESVGGVKEIEDLRRTLDRMAGQVQRYQAALKGYLGALTQAQEEERARLARELHDETVQTLIALGQRTQMVRRALKRDPGRAAERLDELRMMIGDAVEEVRRVSRALRPLYLEELGLVPALEMLAKENDAVFWVNGSSRRLGADQELALYRIAQEALSNTQRHAKARQIQMSLTFVDEGVTLRVQDDGSGFLVPNSFTDFARNGHYGLLGMHERAQHAGGRLTLTSAAGHGTIVEVWFTDEARVMPPPSWDSLIDSTSQT